MEPKASSNHGQKRGYGGFILSLSTPYKIILASSSVAVASLLVNRETAKKIMKEHIAITTEKIARKNFIPFFTSFLYRTSITSQINTTLHLLMANSMIKSMKEGRKGVLKTRETLSQLRDFGVFLAGYGLSWYMKHRLCLYEGEWDEILDYCGVAGAYALMTYLASKHYTCIKFGSSHFPSHYLPIGAFIVGGVYNSLKMVRMNLDQFMMQTSWKFYVGNMSGVAVGFAWSLAMSLVDEV